jgi:hypothetical protein
MLTKYSKISNPDYCSDPIIFATTFVFQLTDNCSGILPLFRRSTRFKKFPTIRTVYSGNSEKVTLIFQFSEHIRLIMTSNDAATPASRLLIFSPGQIQPPGADGHRPGIVHREPQAPFRQTTGTIQANHRHKTNERWA